MKTGSLRIEFPIRPDLLNLGLTRDNHKVEEVNEYEASVRCKCGSMFAFPSDVGWCINAYVDHVIVEIVRESIDA